MVSRLKASTPKMTKDGAKQGNRLPMKKKCKVVSKETIEESEVESKVKAEEANKRFETEWTWALLGISTKMRLMCEAQEKTAKECTNITMYISFIMGDLDFVVDGKRKICPHLHGPVDGKTELLVLNTEGPKDGVEESKDTAEEEAQVDMTMQE